MKDKSGMEVRIKCNPEGVPRSALVKFEEGDLLPGETLVTTRWQGTLMARQGVVEEVGAPLKPATKRKRKASVSKPLANVAETPGPEFLE